MVLWHADDADLKDLRRLFKNPRKSVSSASSACKKTLMNVFLKNKTRIIETPLFRDGRPFLIENG